MAHHEDTIEAAIFFDEIDSLLAVYGCGDLVPVHFQALGEYVAINSIILG